MNDSKRVRCLRAITILLALCATACIPLPGGGTWQSLRVAAKQGPATLIAASGASCVVSSETFARVQIGGNYRCVWSGTQTQDPRRPRTQP